MSKSDLGTTSSSSDVTASGPLNSWQLRSGDGHYVQRSGRGCGCCCGPAPTTASAFQVHSPLSAMTSMQRHPVPGESLWLHHVDRLERPPAVTATQLPC